MFMIRPLSLSAPSQLESFDSDASAESSASWVKKYRQAEDIVQQVFIDSLDQILEKLAPLNHPDCIDELQKIQSEFSIEKKSSVQQRRLDLFSAKDCIVDALEHLSLDQLRNLEPFDFPPGFQTIWKTAKISSSLLHNPNSIGYGEHRVYFKALFQELISLGEMERAERIANQFENSWPLWKRLAANQCILEGLIQKQLIKIKFHFS